MDKQATTKPVLVIGAGVAGLYCAELLHDARVPVVVIEASQHIGGRIKSVQFVDWGWKLVDIGADFIHGHKTVLKKYVDQVGFPCRKLCIWAQGDGHGYPHHIGGGAAMYWLGHKKKLVRWDSDDPEVNQVNRLLWSIGKQDPTKIPDSMSLEQYLKDCGISDDGIGLAEAGYANTMCSAIDRLPLSGVVRMEHAWSRDGDGLYRIDDGMDVVVEHMARNLIIHKNCEVIHIDYTGDDVTVHCKNGKKFVGCKVVCTIPLNVLKSGSVMFTPNLPKEHKLALDAFRMYAAVKVCLEFSTRFWPSELHGMICGHSFIPEFWFEDPEVPAGGISPESSIIGTEPRVSAKKTYLVTGYACAKSAEKISQMTRDDVVKQTLAQLDEIWSNRKINDMLLDNRYGAKKPPGYDVPRINPPSPATKFFLDAMLVDWGKNTYIQGGYSSPPFGATPEMRNIWTVPIDGKLYFGGEAFNQDSIMTLHGAMETSIVNANHIFQRFGKGKTQGAETTPFGPGHSLTKKKKAKL